MKRRVTHLCRNEVIRDNIRISNSILAVKDHHSITKLLDGSSVGVWVIPCAAKDINWMKHFFSGVGDRVHYIEFDADDSELTNPSGIKTFFSGAQNIIITEKLLLAKRNPKFGCLNGRAMPFNAELLERDPTKK